MKYKDIEDKGTKESIRQDVENAGERMGVCSYESTGGSGGSRTRLKDAVGMCFDCTSLEYSRTEFGSVFARCCMNKRPLTGRERIVECNQYVKVGTMSLFDMYNMAWIIESSDDEVKGFLK